MKGLGVKSKYMIPPPHRRSTCPAAAHPQAPPRPAEEPENPLHRLTPEQLEQLGRELDALHEEVYGDLGERDARYIRSTIRFHRQLVIAARLLLLRSDKRPLWLAGTAALSLAKILENMEIGHNVMHGQWDWMNDPDINSRAGTGTPPRRPTHGAIHITTSTTRSPTSAAKTATWGTRSCASTPTSAGTRCIWRSRCTTCC